ncbi:MAG TPA: hypothetical protein VNF68_02000 [Candidatus Baltobacteraceae bacterium]|nr:hypothetical protein [Candidatus Baltobacteraceae bacterium]
MNDSFAYLSVLISIVLGLAVAHLLGSLVRVVNARERTVFYWPSLLWAGTLFLIIAQLWWADASLRTYSHWNFAAFLVLLAQPAALYFLCALILPVPEDRETFDMRAAFARNRAWFFIALLVAVALSFIKELVLYGHLPQGANGVALSLFAVFALVALALKSELAQKINAVVAAIMMVAYIVVLFSALPV